MPIRYEASTAYLEGVCTVEEAMDIQDWLRKTDSPEIDLADCTHFHTAIFQVLSAARPRIASRPKDVFLAQWITPLLSGDDGDAQGSDG
ncbi:Transcriptional regulator [Azospirillaceae bacterium]